MMSRLLAVMSEVVEFACESNPDIASMKAAFVTCSALEVRNKFWHQQQPAQALAIQSMWNVS